MRPILEQWLAVTQLIGEGWEQGREACDIQGQSVDACSTKAASFCLSGAMKHVAFGDWNLWDTMIDELNHEVTERTGKEGAYCVDWNDVEGRTHEEVLDLLAGFIARNVDTWRTHA